MSLHVKVAFLAPSQLLRYATLVIGEAGNLQSERRIVYPN